MHIAYFLVISTYKNQEEEEKYNLSFLEILKLNAPEWKYLVVGAIAACILGASFPLWAILFGDFFGVNT